MRALLAAGLLALAAGGCGGGDDAPAARPQGTAEATVATVESCMAKAGAKPAGDLTFATHAAAGAVGRGLDGRTTYEFKPRDPAKGDWRIFRTRPSSAPKPTAAQAADPPEQGEQVAVLTPPADPAAVKRAQGCADGAPE